MTIKKRGPTKNSRKRSREDESSLNANNTVKKEPNRKKRVSDNATSQLRVGAGILVLAIAVSCVWNYLDTSVDPRMRDFFATACRNAASCARFVVPLRRSLQAARPIRPGEKLVEIPRVMQFWDLDALRDDFVRDNLFSARHPRTGNKLARGAFLAAWLSMLIKDSSLVGTDHVRKSYLEILPTAEELTDHPILWDKTELRESLGLYSMNYAVALNYREMVTSEYDAFRLASADFATSITLAEYTAARINVLSRSFNPGPVGMEENLDSEELETYKMDLGIDFSEGCHAMVPILDMLNHHPNPNVAYTYNKEKRAFIISAKKHIPSGWELMDSYGKFADSHLFSKFGFVNGDGSGYLYTTIARFHRSVDFDMKHEFNLLSVQNETANKPLMDIQRRDMRLYLQYDDGYPECIKGAEQNPTAFELKRLKYKHLVANANNPKSWNIKLSPREPDSEPAEASNLVITEVVPDIDLRKVRLDLRPIMSNCRLMSLIESDYDGRAIEILTENLGNKSFEVMRGSDELEFRSLMCLARLASIGQMQYNVNMTTEAENVARLTREEFQSRNWTTAHLRLGELQALNILASIAFMNAKKLESTFNDPSATELIVRDESCPLEYQDVLPDWK